MDAQPQHPKKRDWRRAWKAIRVLTADSSRTDQVFELLAALEGVDGGTGTCLHGVHHELRVPGQGDQGGK